MTYYNWYQVKDSKYVYMVSEHFDGLSAEELFKENMEISELKFLTLKLLMACARGFRFLMKNGITDSMVTISNLIMNRFGEIKIANYCVLAKK